MSRYWPTPWSRREPGRETEDEREWRRRDALREGLRGADLRNREFFPIASSLPPVPMAGETRMLTSKPVRASCGRDPKHCDEWRCCLTLSMMVSRIEE